jgi:F-type H+-transporting ATPase subunit c
MVKRMMGFLPGVLAVVAIAAPALAAEESAAGFSMAEGLMALAAGLAIGIAAFGGALGQSRGLASALDGIARNPSASGKLVTPMIIGLAMIESLVIYALVIGLMIVLKF